MSPHTFDPGVFAVCQATLSFPLSGSSHLWFGSVTQQLRYVCVCVCFFPVLYLPHGQNMALALIKSKCLQRIAVSASVELMIGSYFPLWQI